MNTLYTNLNVQDYYPYYPLFEESTVGQERSFTFATRNSSIPASNIESIGNGNSLVYAMLNEAVKGFVLEVFLNDPTVNEDSVPTIFANRSEISLPSAVGETVNGTLDIIDMNFQTQDPSGGLR